MAFVWRSSPGPWVSGEMPLSVDANREPNCRWRHVLIPVLNPNFWRSARSQTPFESNASTIGQIENLMNRKTGEQHWEWLYSNPTSSREILERFWSKVKVGSEDECWMWTVGKSTYVNFSVGPRKTCKQFSAHVFSYKVAQGLRASPCCKDGSRVIGHLCDTPRCANPGHLVLQT